MTGGIAQYLTDPIISLESKTTTKETKQVKMNKFKMSLVLCHT